MDFRAAGGDSETVMKFAAVGANATDEKKMARVRHFSAIWRDLNGRGHTRQTEERYIEVNLAADGLFTVAR